MIKAIKLAKSFGALKAVRDVSLNVKRGEVVGLLGPNGAGKTTTFRMMAGTLGPTSGRVEIAGVDLQLEPLKAKVNLGYMPENAPLYPELTGKEYLVYRAELRKIPHRRQRSSVALASERSGVTSMLGVRIAHLSKGFKQRLALADALLGEPPVLLLDEPTAGLDPNQVLEVRSLLRSLACDHAIVISTHILSEVEATCSRAIVIHEGRVVGEGTLSELRNQRSNARARLIVQAEEDALRKCLHPLSKENDHFSLRIDKAPTEIQSEQNTRALQVEIPLPDSRTLSRAIALCCQANLPVLEASPFKAPLDEVFAHLTRQGNPSSVNPSEEEPSSQEDQ